jgi:hypothetical protein
MVEGLFGFCLQFDVSCLKMASLQFKIEKGIASVSGAEAKGNQTEKGTPYGDSNQWWHHC